MRAFRAHPPRGRARASQGLVVIPTDSATDDQRARYAAYAEARLPRTRRRRARAAGVRPRPRRALRRDRRALWAHAGFREVDEVVFALPFAFEHDDYVSRSSPTSPSTSGRRWGGPPGRVERCGQRAQAGRDFPLRLRAHRPRHGGRRAAAVRDRRRRPVPHDRVGRVVEPRRRRWLLDRWLLGDDGRATGGTLAADPPLRSRLSRGWCATAVTSSSTARRPGR